MLKVTLHASTPPRANVQNLIGRLDIGYATLDAEADYKAVMVSTGLGEKAPAALKKYPRWSASLWDLVARMACLCIDRREEIWPVDIPVMRRGAFINNLSAVVEHWPDGSDMRRATVATAHVAMNSKRCNYIATFEDDILGTTKSRIFRHTPAVLTPWDLLTRAYAWATTESFLLPPRPRLYTPLPFIDEGKSYVCLETVQEPARTGCFRWLAKRGLAAVDIGALTNCVTESHYVEFLRRGV